MTAKAHGRRPPLRIGLMVPSSNTVVETEMPRLIPGDGSVTLHFARLGVTRISDSAASKAQFELDRMLECALALADMRPDVIVWAGTAASWLGFARDDELADRIRVATGIAATTSLLAVNMAVARLGVDRIGLVTPYTEPLERQIVANYAAAGIAVVASERLDLTVNTDYAAVAPAAIARMCRSVAKAGPAAIVIMCTNLAGAPIARETSDALGIPVIDSVAATLEGALRCAAAARPSGRTRRRRPTTA